MTEEQKEQKSQSKPKFPWLFILPLIGFVLIVGIIISRAYFQVMEVQRECSEGGNCPGVNIRENPDGSTTLTPVIPKDKK
jgi:hypothetical protein